jgi:hypothetical protein
MLDRKIDTSNGSLTLDGVALPLASIKSAGVSKRQPMLAALLILAGIYSLVTKFVLHDGATERLMNQTETGPINLDLAFAWALLIGLVMLPFIIGLLMFRPNTLVLNTTSGTKKLFRGADAELLEGYVEQINVARQPQLQGTGK